MATKKGQDDLYLKLPVRFTLTVFDSDETFPFFEGTVTEWKKFQRLTMMDLYRRYNPEYKKYLDVPVRKRGPKDVFRVLVRSGIKEKDHFFFNDRIERGVNFLVAETARSVTTLYSVEEAPKFPAIVRRTSFTGEGGMIQEDRDFAGRFRDIIVDACDKAEAAGEIKEAKIELLSRTLWDQTQFTLQNWFLESLLNLILEKNLIKVNTSGRYAETAQQ